MLEAIAMDAVGSTLVTKTPSDADETRSSVCARTLYRLCEAGLPFGSPRRHRRSTLLALFCESMIKASSVMMSKTAMRIWDVTLASSSMSTSPIYESLGGTTPLSLTMVSATFTLTTFYRKQPTFEVILRKDSKVLT